MRALLNIIRFQVWWIGRLLFKPTNLEIHLADHCNLNCASCSHYSPLAAQKFCDVDVLTASLSKLSRFENEFRSIRLLGGEPLLNQNVTKIISLIRMCFPNIRIELVTNGLLLMPPFREYINDAFWTACRNNKIMIAVTIYPSMIDTETIKKTCLERGVKFRVYGNRTGNDGFNRFLLDPKRQGKKMNYYRCQEIDCLQLVGNKIFSCAQCAYVGSLNQSFGYSFEQNKKDYIAVDEISRAFAIRRFRLRAKPFCKYCVFPHPKTDWSKSQKKAEEWVQRIE